MTLLDDIIILLDFELLNLTIFPQR